MPAHTWKHTLQLKDLLTYDEEPTVDSLHKVADEVRSRLIHFCHDVDDKDAFQWYDIQSQLSEFINDPEPSVDHFNVILDELYDVADDKRVWVE